ncbi:hypothetical protein C7N43_14705 [Sphingobacteriales bacterium UPWRP_1]|nr:hypothetical protein BVG80_05085 [Sphingobacteriales bacterium TSM_CSM]PSJ76246.1 hypothetical protein C7N43_14705 [Sphingobacteriales bacterium UPWRP_1]
MPGLPTESKEPPIIKVHAQQLMLYALLASLSVLFIGLSVAYLFAKGNWHWAQFSFPRAFIVSSLALAASSYTIQQTVNAHKLQHEKQLLTMMALTLGFTLLFVAGQMLGWYELYSKGIYIAGKPDGSYLYLLSGLHILHVLAGLVILLFLYVNSRKSLSDPVQKIFYFVETHHGRRLAMTATYWHFVDILWLYLLLFFLLNHL